MKYLLCVHECVCVCVCMCTPRPAHMAGGAKERVSGADVNKCISLGEII